MTTTEQRSNHSHRRRADRRPNFPHIRALDGLRGFAVVLVVLSHFAPVATPGGFLGVDLFFLLSGFLITGLLVTEFHVKRRIALGMFWIRRARRLLPALFAVLLVVFVVTALTKNQFEQHQTGLDGLSSVFYVANWRFIASGQSYVVTFMRGTPSPLRHMWSLAIEEQFYLIWPLVVVGFVAVIRAVRPRRTVHVRIPLAVLSLSLAAVSALIMIVLGITTDNLDRIYYGTDSRVFIILLGAAIGAISAGKPQLPEPFRRVIVALGGLALIGLLALTLSVHTGDRWLYLGGYLAIAVGMCALLVGAAQEGTNPLRRIFEFTPLCDLGLVSYGIYLWHWPLSLWITTDSTGFEGLTLFLARTAATLVCAYASFLLIEQPIRERGLGMLHTRLRFLAAPLAVGGLALCFLFPVLRFPEFPPTPTNEPVVVTDAQQAAYLASPRCDGPEGDGTLAGTSGLTVQLVGNSLADETRTCLGTILESRGATLEPFINGYWCTNLSAIEQATIDPTTRPDVGILFGLVAFGDSTGCGDSWMSAVDQLVDVWVTNGVKVVLVPSVPAPVGGRTDLNPGSLLELAHYDELAAAHPGSITVIDAGTYLRDATGAYVWNTACLPDEAGCGDNGQISLRFVDGIHFCTTPDVPHSKCPDPAQAGGERRVSATIAAALVRALEAWKAPPTTTTTVVTTTTIPTTPIADPMDNGAPAPL